jgi:hypothetical protein
MRPSWGISSNLIIAAIALAGCSGKVAAGKAEPSANAGAPAGEAGSSSVIGGSSNTSSRSAAGDGGNVSASDGGGRDHEPATGGATVSAGGTNAGGGAGGTGGAETGGATASSGGAAAGALGTAGAPGKSTEVLITPVNGWVDGGSNVLLIQGAVYTGADSQSAANLSSDFTGSNMCIKGKAAKVDLGCTPIPPAPDCQMTTWGAAIYLNLNQALDQSTMMGGAPGPYDASRIRGFAFELSGPIVPKTSELRFWVETEKWQFCSEWNKQLKPGDNTVLLSELYQYCSITPHQNPPATSVASILTRLEWQVMTNSTSEVPYDFCVSNLRALYK